DGNRFHAIQRRTYAGPTHLPGAGGGPEKGALSGRFPQLSRATGGKAATRSLEPLTFPGYCRNPVVGLAHQEQEKQQGRHMSEASKPKQLLHLVFGGELEKLSGSE